MQRAKKLTSKVCSQFFTTKLINCVQKGNVNVLTFNLNLQYLPNNLTTPTSDVCIKHRYYIKVNEHKSIVRLSSLHKYCWSGVIFIQMQINGKRDLVIIRWQNSGSATAKLNSFSGHEQTEGLEELPIPRRGFVKHLFFDTPHSIVRDIT